MPKKFKLGEILLKTKMINESQLKVGLAYQNQWGVQLGEAMIALGFISEHNLLRVLSHQLRIPAVDFRKITISPQVLGMLKQDFVETHNVIPIRKKVDKAKEKLLVATPDPLNVALLDEMQFLTSMTVQYVIATRSSIKKAIQKYYLHLDVDFTEDEDAHYLLFKDVKEDEFEVLKADNPVLAGHMIKEGSASPVAPDTKEEARPKAKLKHMISQDSRAIVSLLIKKGIITKKEFLDELYKHS